MKNFACFRPPPVRKRSTNPTIQREQQLAVHRNPLNLVQREIAILKKLSHPNVVKLVEVRYVDSITQSKFALSIFRYLMILRYVICL